jgi:hypothetical protein
LGKYELLPGINSCATKKTCQYKGYIGVNLFLFFIEECFLNDAPNVQLIQKTTCVGIAEMDKIEAQRDGDSVLRKPVYKCSGF